ncbi:MAG: sulfotransferase [Deltaproteobacteria bacterium]|nr:sulfotransferase [Deltaproteobacteria bacterium]
MKFNTICGTPRSGSTLLCNILNQNPRFHASSTSCVASSARALSNLWSHSPEIKSQLLHDAEVTTTKMVGGIRAMIEAWYAGNGEVIFDKDRHWNHSPLLLHQIFPESHMFVMVRDLRAVMASIEKQHAKNPVLDEASGPLELHTYNRADRMLSPQGLVGQHVAGIEDLMRRNLPYVHMIQFETLVKNPKLVLDSIYTVLGEDGFAHDFTHVENTATDADALYLGKYPHEGSGAVKVPEGLWSDHVPQDIGGLIMQRFAAFNQAFGYLPQTQN